MSDSGAGWIQIKGQGTIGNYGQLGTAAKQEAKKLRFKVNDKEVTIETDKPFISIARLFGVAEAGASSTLYRRGITLHEINAADYPQGVIFPDGDEFYTVEYLRDK